MVNTFYITEVKEHWYQLIVFPAHVVLACGSSLWALLSKVEDYVVKYKTAERLLQRVREMEYGAKPPHRDLEERIRVYESVKDTFRNYINEAVSSGIRKNQKDSLYNKVKKKVLHICSPLTVYAEENKNTEVVEEYIPKVVFTKPLVRRVSLLKI